LHEWPFNCALQKEAPWILHSGNTALRRQVIAPGTRRDRGGCCREEELDQLAGNSSTNQGGCHRPVQFKFRVALNRGPRHQRKRKYAHSTNRSDHWVAAAWLGEEDHLRPARIRICPPRNAGSDITSYYESRRTS